jgi:proline iminopeptidase
MTDLYARTIGPEDADQSLVFMHGPGLDHTCFLPFVQPLASKDRLIFYDARLNGRSPRTSDGARLDQLVDDLRQIIDAHAGGRPTIAVAHSWAPLVALAAAEAAIPNLKGLILVCPGLSHTVADTLLRHVIANGTPAQRAAIEAAFAGQLQTDVEFEAAWRELLPLYLAQPAGPLIGYLCQDTTFSARGFSSFAEGVFGRIDGMAVIAQLQLPVLIVAGAHDWIEKDSAGGSRAVAGASTRATLLTLENSGHFPFAEEPDAFVASVRDWLVTHRENFSVPHRAAGAGTLSRDWTTGPQE